MPVEQSSKSICPMVTHAPVQCKRKNAVFPYKYCHRHARIKDVLDIPKLTLFSDYFIKYHPFSINVSNISQVKNGVSTITVVILAVIDVRSWSSPSIKRHMYAFLVTARHKQASVGGIHKHL